jgi:hypothetical protein
MSREVKTLKWFKVSCTRDVDKRRFYVLFRCLNEEQALKKFENKYKKNKYTIDGVETY